MVLDHEIREKPCSWICDLFTVPRPSSAAAAALGDSKFPETSIVAAVCCSTRFMGIGRSHEAPPGSSHWTRKSFVVNKLRFGVRKATNCNRLTRKDLRT